jgi:hypothetical protein
MNRRTTDRGAILSGILTATFFLFYYSYVRECLDPRMLYHANDLVLPSGQWIEFPICVWGTAFFKEFAGRPGGLIQYLAAICSQFYHDPCLGPLILTLLACLASIFTDRLIRLGGSPGMRWLRYGPPLLLLITYNRYTFLLENCLAPLAALMAAAGYVLASKRLQAAPIRFVLFALPAAVLYYAVGGPFLLFAVWCGLYELLGRRRYFLGGSYLLVASGIPLLGASLFHVTAAEAYFSPSGIFSFERTVSAAYSAERVMPKGSSLGGHGAGSGLFGEPAKSASLAAFYLFFFLAAALVPLAPRLATSGSVVTAWAKKLARYYPGGKPTPLQEFLILLTAAACVAWCTLDASAHKVLRANYLARVEAWPEFLEQIEKHPSSDYPAYMILDVNRALFETGQLGSKMFAYPQNRDSLLRQGWQTVLYKGNCELLLRLGRVNEAEHAALEALEITGERPETLRILATVYIVKHQPEAARVFLRGLSRDIAQAAWARDRLRRLEEDPLLTSDPEIQHLRSIMPETDAVTPSQEEMLLALLARNPGNRMALEYLMAYYLLTKQAGKVACNIGRLEDVGDPTIPEHYAEAVLLYSNATGRPPDLGGRSIGQRTVEQVREAIRLAREYQGDAESLDRALRAGFPNSYCRYFFTGRSGDAR